MTEWHDNGQKASEINSKNGEIVDGVVTILDKDGDVIKTETYKDGKLVSSNYRLFENIFDKLLDKITPITDWLFRPLQSKKYTKKKLQKKYGHKEEQTKLISHGRIKLYSMYYKFYINP